MQACYCKRPTRLRATHQDSGKSQAIGVAVEGFTAAFGLRIATFRRVSNSQFAMHDEPINLQPLPKHENLTLEGPHNLTKPY